MRFLLILTLQLGWTVVAANAQIAGANVTLTTTPNPSVLSQSVTLTATVSVPSASGNITFFEKDKVLGVAPVREGRATLVAKLRTPGARSFRARPSGGGITGAGASNVVSHLVIVLPATSFVPGDAFQLAGATQGLLASDFNHDGLLDVVETHRTDPGSQANVTLHLATGQGTYAIKRGPYPAGIRFAKSVLLADFDADGNSDILVVGEQVKFDDPLGLSSAESALALLLGDGTGALRSTHVRSTPGISSGAIAAGDFNGDGILDVALGASSRNEILILLGQGQGVLTELTRVPLDVNLFSDPCALAVEDLNRDGVSDLIASSCNNDSVLVLLGLGTGGFQPQQRTVGGTIGHGAGDLDNQLATGDMNGDGFVDVVRQAPFQMQILLGDGAGNLVVSSGADSKYQVRFPTQLAVADFDGDNKLDVAFAQDSELHILAGDGAGGLRLSPEPQVVATPTASYPVDAEGFVTGDFNEDGRLDVFAFARYSGSPLKASLLTATYGPSLDVSSGGFRVGDRSEYVLTVSNFTAQATQGDIRVSHTLGAGLTPTAVIGRGWDCRIDEQVVNCLRSDTVQPAQHYPFISVEVEVRGEACPVGGSSAEVSMAGRKSDFESIRTAVAGCLRISLLLSPPVVNSRTAATLLVSAAPGAALQPGFVSATLFVPAGISPTVFPDEEGGWSCSVQAGQIVSCQRNDSFIRGDSYPPIEMTLDSTFSACPGALMSYAVLFNDVPQDSETRVADPLGCLRVEPLPDLPPVQVTTPVGFGLTLTSLDRHALSLDILGGSIALPLPIRIDPLQDKFSICCVQVAAACIGENRAEITLLASQQGSSSGRTARIPVPVKVFGAPSNLFFSRSNGPLLIDNSTLTPGGEPIVLSQPVTTPSASPLCPKPDLAVSLPKAPDGSNYDAGFVPATGALTAGTVAGTIELTARVNGSPISPLSGPASVRLHVPSMPGVVTNLSISNRTESTFEMTVSGYSTPRETGDGATTEICFGFQPVSGANVTSLSPPCALRKDIAIWYDRTASFPTGSQFKGTVSVSYRGESKAIGQIKVWIHNREGDGSPACIDYQSGVEQTCR